MIVAVVAVRMVQVAVHKVIDMIAMWHGFVAATGSVDVAGFVAAAGCRATIGVRGAHFDDMFIDVIAMRVMEVAVVQVIDMSLVFHSGVAAAWAVLMIVVGMSLAGVHGNDLPLKANPACLE